LRRYIIHVTIYYTYVALVAAAAVLQQHVPKGRSAALILAMGICGEGEEGNLTP